MRIVFMGSPAAAVHPLAALLASEDHEVVAVVSQPARPSGRKRLLLDPPVAVFARQRELLTLQPEKARAPDFLDELRALKPDVVVTAAYGQILSQAFLDIPSRATINIHPSLLPSYRGAIPVPATLLDGCTETGVTILFTVKALDAGAIIVQEKTAIAPRERADELLDRLFIQSGPLLLVALNKLHDPGFVGISQDEDRVTHCTKISKDDGRIDWKWSAKMIENRFRAFQPWPGLFTYIADRRFAITSVAGVVGVTKDIPGAFSYSKADRQIHVATGEGTLLIDGIKPEGGKAMDAAGFWNGLKDKKSLQFDSVEGAPRE